MHTEYGECALRCSGSSERQATRPSRTMKLKLKCLEFLCNGVSSGVVPIGARQYCKGGVDPQDLMTAARAQINAPWMAGVALEVGPDAIVASLKDQLHRARAVSKFHENGQELKDGTPIALELPAVATVSPAGGGSSSDSASGRTCWAAPAAPRLLGHTCRAGKDT